MSDRELLEHILYELRVANWYSRGRKGNPPTAPGKQAIHVGGHDLPTTAEAISANIAAALDAA